jgi:hypothetical protein
MGIVDKYYDINTEVRIKLLLSAAVALFLPIFMHYTYSFWFFPLVNGFDCTLNSKENYTFSNCRFMEYKENVVRRWSK